MASDSSGPDRNDGLPEVDAKGTYERFMGITKWVVIGIAVALILMALLLV